jgi:hypothetical protein
MLFATITHQHENSLGAMPMLVENSLVCLADTRTPAESIVEWQFILPLKTLIRKGIEISLSRIK